MSDSKQEPCRCDDCLRLDEEFEAEVQALMADKCRNKRGHTQMTDEDNYDPVRVWVTKSGEVLLTEPLNIGIPTARPHFLADPLTHTVVKNGELERLRSQLETYRVTFHSFVEGSDV